MTSEQPTPKSDKGITRSTQIHAERHDLAPGVQTTFESVFQESTYTTAFPPPEYLAQLKYLDPTYPERLIQMAESAVAHRQRIEGRQAEAEMRALARGQWFTLILGIAVVALAFYMIHKGQINAGVITAFAGIITPVLASFWAYHRTRGSDPPPPKD